MKKEPLALLVLCEGGSASTMNADWVSEACLFQRLLSAMFGIGGCWDSAAVVVGDAGLLDSFAAVGGRVWLFDVDME